MTNQSAIKKLLDFKKTLDQELAKFLKREIKEAAKTAPGAKEMIEHITDLTLRGGKRIRAALMYYSYLAHGGKNLKEALFASMGMEMSETFLLTHDDIIDNDSLRRGGITIHADYQAIAKKRYPKKIDSREFGNSMAILAGDVACAFSNEIIANSKFKAENRIRAIQELSNTYKRELFGEAFDLISVLEDKITKKDVILIQQLKTASYTFDAPVKLGAILAGADEKQIKALERYTVPMGTAFQIQDDILGMFSSEDKLGKSVISDLREGKKTLLILDALENAKPKQKAIIEANLGSKKANHHSLELVRKVIIDTGSLDYSKDMAKKLVEGAIEALQNLKLEKEGKSFLLGIAEYMISREY